MNEEKPRVTCLLLEDEDRVAETLTAALNRSGGFDFAVERAKDLQECLAKGLGDRDFTVCIVDLRLRSDQLPEESGTFEYIAIRSFCSPGSLIVVYSAYPQPERIVRALKAGATEFVAKMECTPHELCSRIERMLKQRSTAAERARVFDEAVRSHAAEWQREYDGHVIAVVGDRVIASGTCRLGVLLGYLAARRKDPSLPEEPTYLGIAAKGGVR